MNSELALPELMTGLLLLLGALDPEGFLTLIETSLDEAKVAPLKMAIARQC